MHYNVYNNICKNSIVPDMHQVLLGTNKMHQQLCD